MRRNFSTLCNICSLNLNYCLFEKYFYSALLKNPVRNKKKQNRRPKPREHTENHPFAILVFFTQIFFDTVTLLKNLIFSRKNFNVSKCPPSLFSIVCNKLDFQKAAKSSFSIFGIVRFFNTISQLFFWDQLRSGPRNV